MNVLLALVAILALALLYVALPVGVAMWSAWRRPRITRCAAIPAEAIIRVRRAGLAEVAGCRALRRVAGCSLWPWRQGCEQRCLEAPDEAMRVLPLRRS